MLQAILKLYIETVDLDFLILQGIQRPYAFVSALTIPHLPVLPVAANGSFIPSCRDKLRRFPFLCGTFFCLDGQILFSREIVFHLTLKPLEVIQEGRPRFSDSQRLRPPFQDGPQH